MLRTKIVCTIGPASRTPEILAALMHAGLDVARLNFSHGSPEFHGENIRRIRSAADLVGKPVPILVDLQGPKLRVGHIPGDGVPIEHGQQLVLTTADVATASDRVPVQFALLHQAVKPGHRILIDDGLLELEVEKVEGPDVHCRVLTGGMLQANKGLNLPRADLSIPAITEKDREDLRFALERRVDWIALSFVRQAQEILELKQLIRELAPFGQATPVIAKIEKPEAFDNIDSIIAAADGIMVARGDLGIETAPESVPMMQKAIIHACNKAGVPVITATQMLDSMIRNPRPTRAEASDVANAILDGTDAIMLSGETAVGKYPVRVVETMARIAERAEREIRPVFSLPTDLTNCTITEAVCHAATDTVHMLKASAIIAPTVGGTTARTLAQFRPPCPIIAVTPNPTVQRQLMLYWGIRTLGSRRATNTDTVIELAVQAALKAGMIQEGETVVATAGSVGSAPGVTDLIKVHTLARTLAVGHGIGSRTVVGRIRRLEGPLDPDVRIDYDEIVVTSKTDRTFVHALRSAAGLISADGGTESHCHLLAMELNLPAVVGIREVPDALAEGRWVVLDSEQGVVVERVGTRDAPML